MNINLTPEVAEGTYANLAVIAHSSSEFILDFVRMMQKQAFSRLKTASPINNSLRQIKGQMSLTDVISSMSEEMAKHEQN